MELRGCSSRFGNFGCNYFPNDDPSFDPPMSWRSAATLLFTNWLNYYVYQITPYDISELGKK